MVKRLTAIIIYIISVIILPAIMTVIIADSNMIMVSAKNDRTQILMWKRHIFIQ